MMKFTNTILVGALALFFLSGVEAQAATVQRAEMEALATGDIIVGGGTLTRTRREVWAQLAATGLDTNAAYTVWWIVFNNPGACSDGECGLDDLGNADAAPGAFYATGFVTGADGIANISAHLRSGRLANGIDDPLGSGQGLNRRNGLAAEIHLIIRSHGDLVLGSVGDQISTIGGACDVSICEDQQAIRFLP